MFNRRQLTHCLLAAPFVMGVSKPNRGPPNRRYADTLGGTTINLDTLPRLAAPNPAAYAALKVRSMAAGTAFNDPVTRVRTVKVTADGTPVAGQFCTIYSTQGLQISQPWGRNLDRYTIAFIDMQGSVHLCDYILGGTTSNYRAGPSGAGRVSFSRGIGKAQLMYVQSGAELSRYDTAANTVANSGIFPIMWSTDRGANCWLQLNQTESWATALNSDGTAVTAINTTTGKVISQNLAGIDELYSGYDDVALINCDGTGVASPSAYVWNLDTNEVGSIGLPFGVMGKISHVPSMRGFWVATDTVTGGGVMPLYLIGEDGTHSQSSSFQGYYGGWHSCGHWRQTAGPNQYALYSMWGAPEQGWTKSLEYALVFARCSDGSTATLGHHYSRIPAAATHPYWSQPRATQSSDGRLVLFGSNMLDGPRLDLFLMEVPRV